MVDGGGSAPRSVTGRVLALLGAFDPAHRRLRVTDLARRTGLPGSTAHRLAAELVAWGALHRDDDGWYSIGLRLWETGALAPVADRLREAALPSMQELCASTRDAVHLAVPDSFDVLYVERLSGYRSVPVVSRTGTRLPMHATGVGRVLLAHADDEFVHSYLERPLSRFTRFTTIDPGRLLRELRATADRGYAVVDQEVVLGSCSVAVAVRGEGGVPVGALGVVVRAVRADPSRVLPGLRSAAATIARRLTAATHDHPPAVRPVPHRGP